MAPSERYTIISADSHAGGNMAMYEEYLADEWRDAFALLADQGASGAVKVAFDQR